MGTESDASRQAIIVAVWKVIASSGIEAVTFRRVAQLAEVSVGRIQHHFGSRDVLVRAACTAMINMAHTQYQELPDEPQARLAHILLHAIPDTPVRRFGASVWYAYLAKSVDDAEIGRLLAETKRGTEDECVRLIEHMGVPAGEGQPDAPRIARRLLALADGLTVRVLVGDIPGAEARDLLSAELADLTGRLVNG